MDETKKTTGGHYKAVYWAAPSLSSTSSGTITVDMSVGHILMLVSIRLIPFSTGQLHLTAAYEGVV